jgi:hypothetical protein
MFDPSTAIRVFGFARHPGLGRIQTTAAKPVQITGADVKADVKADKPAKDLGWHHPEWWEYHNYERR